MFFRSLESWRGLVALAVALFHFAGGFRPAEFGPFVRDSYLFVDFFFVLSGLVISTAYADQLPNPGAPGRFVIRRFGRLWPLHMATFLAVLAWQLRKGGQPDLSLFTGAGLNPLLTNTLMIHALGFNTSLTFNFPSWSISAEFWSCFVFMLVIRFGGRQAPWIAALIVAVSMAIVFQFFYPGADATYDFGLPRALSGFFCGYFVALLIRQFGARAPGGTFAEIAVLVSVIVFVTVAGKPTSIPLPASFHELMPMVLAPLVFAPAVLVFAKDAGVISALLNLPPFRYLGRISYSIYMVHGLSVIVLPSVLNVVSNRTGVDWTQKTLGAEAAAGAWGRLLLVLAVYLAVTVLVAGVTYRLIEQPGRRRFNRIAQSAARERAPAPAEVPGG